MKNYYMYFCRIKINTIFATLLKKSKGGVLEVPNCCVTFETVPNGRLAQLVQSICLTSRGSAVRIRQRPQREKTEHKQSSELVQFCTLAFFVL